MEDSNASMQTFLQRSTEVPVDSPSVVYTTHVQGYGWLEPPASNGQLSGTEGESKRIEAIKISLENTPYSGDIKYKSFMYKIMVGGDSVINGGISGTSGESKRLESFKSV